MESDRGGYSSIDEYISTFPMEVQKLLEECRAAIRAAVPDAQEKISYGMPAFALKGNVVHFAAHKNHVGLYPTPSGTDAFEAELSAYKRGKGSVQFPFGEPLPLELIGRIAKYRADENISKALDKKRGPSGRDPSGSES